MSQVTDPVMLDSTGQIIVSKLQDVIDAINGGTIDPLTVTQNGTYTPSGTTLGYGPVTVNVGGGGGGITILSGTDAPTAAQGDNGQIYLKYLDVTLPAEYSELEYLEFVNRAYINTGVIPNNHSVEIKVDDVSYVNDKHWFGTNPSNPGGFMHFTTYNNKYYWGYTGTEGNGGSWSSGMHLLKYNYGDNNQIILDGTVIGSGFSASTAALNIGRRGTAANAANLRVYYFILTNKAVGAIERYYIPAARISDGVAGLYDVITQQFYTNAGSGTFIQGQVIQPAARDLFVLGAYAKVGGAWQSLIGTDINDIDLGS